MKVGTPVRYIGERGTGEFAFLVPGATLFVRSVDEAAGTVYVQSPWDNIERTTLRLDEVEEKR